MTDTKYGFSLNNIENTISNIENYPYSNLDVALESELGLIKSDYYDTLYDLQSGTEGFIGSIGRGIQNVIKWFWDKLVAIFNFITGRSKKNKKLSALDIYNQEMAAVKKIMDAYDTSLDTLIKTVREDGDWTKEDEKYPLYLSMYNEKDRMLDDKKSFYVIEPNITPEDINSIFDECKKLVVKLGEITKDTTKLDTFLEDSKSSETDIRKIINSLNPKIDRLKGFRQYRPKKVSSIEDVKKYQKEFKNVMSIILKRTQDVAVTSEKIYYHLIHLKLDKGTELEKAYIKNNMSEEDAVRKSMDDVEKHKLASLFKDITDALFNFKALKTVLLRASIADMKICINHNKNINPKTAEESFRYGFESTYDLMDEGNEGFFDGVKSLFSRKSKTIIVDMTRDQFIKEANKFFLSKKNELDSILKKYPKVCKDYYIETIYDKYDPEYNAINLRIDFSKGLNFIEDRNSDAFKVSTLFGCNEDGTQTFIDKVKKEFKDKFNIDPEIDGDTDCVFIGTPDIDKITFNDSSNSGAESFNIFDI